MDIDLSSLGSSASPPPPAPKATDTKNFVADVIKASATRPVLVDFWAPWCGPCKQLTPLLEKVVGATKGKVALVTLDVDKNQALATQMGVQSIPAVFAFYKGQPVDGFMGAQPESALKTFVDKLLKLSGNPSEGAGVEDILARAEEALSAGDLDTANGIYAAVLEEDPTHAGAYAGLIRVALAAGQTEEARAMLDEAPAGMAAARDLAGVRAQLALLAQASSAPSADLDALQKRLAAHPDDHAARYDLAQALYARGQVAEAIDQLIDIIRRNKAWNEEAARKHLLTLFDALGPTHEETVAGRRKLSSVLFR